MSLQAHVVASILVLVGLICLAVLLRRVKILGEEHGPLFAKLVSQVTLPALIFHSLAYQVINWDQAFLAGIMFGAEVCCLVLAWLVGRGLKLDRSKLGAFILTAGFGSSSLLGYALISQIFNDNAGAITEAVIISELGVGPALFTIGVMVAIYFGSQKVAAKERISAALAFFRSPIFISLIAGLACAVIGLPKGNPIIDAVFNGIGVVAMANTLAVALTVGLILHLNIFSAGTALLAGVCCIKLIIKPILVWLPSLATDISVVGMQVLVLEAAMPSAMLGVVLANRYGCDGGLAAKLAFATTVASAVTVLTMFSLLT